MKQVRKRRVAKKHPWRILVWMILSTMLLSLLSAKLILWGKIGEGYQQFVPYIIVSIVSVCGAFLTARTVPQRALLWGMAIALGYVCCLMMGNLLFFGVAYRGVVSIIAYVLVGGFAGSSLGIIRRGKIA